VDDGARRVLPAIKSAPVPAAILISSTSNPQLTADWRRAHKKCFGALHRQNVGDASRRVDSGAATAGGAQHHVCPCACSNADFQHTQPKRMARWALALGVSVQAQNNNRSTCSKQSRRCLFNKLNFFSNVLLCFIRIGQFALFSLKEKIQQIDLFEEKKICQVYKI